MTVFVKKQLFMIEPEGSPDGQQVVCQLGIRTYQALGEKPEELGVTAHIAPRISSTGFHIGDLIIVSPEEKLELSMDWSAGKPGEIDLTVILSATFPLENEPTINALRPIFDNLKLLITAKIGDYLVPLGPIHLAEATKERGEKTSKGTAKVFCWDRPNVSDGEIKDIFSSLFELLDQSNGREFAKLGVAGRRYIDALVEIDPIDKYCDLWEACEFLCRPYQVKGNIVSAIASSLSSRTKIRKKKLENGIIRKLYEIRKGIVHEALEHSDELERAAKALQEIALELLKQKLDIPYIDNELIAKSLDSDFLKKT